MEKMIGECGWDSITISECQEWTGGNSTDESHSLYLSLNLTDKGNRKSPPPPHTHTLRTPSISPPAFVSSVLSSLSLPLSSLSRSLSISLSLSLLHSLSLPLSPHSPPHSPPLSIPLSLSPSLSVPFSPSPFSPSLPPHS